MCNKLILRMMVAGALLTGAFFLRADGPPQIPAPTEKHVLRNVDPNLAEKLIAAKRVVVLDVRTEEEFKDGHIKGATNINFLDSNFDKRLSDLDKSKAYLVHCAAGNRSAKVVKKMQDQDFKTIFHLDSGLTGWEKAGKPTVKD